LPDSLASRDAVLVAVQKNPGGFHHLRRLRSFSIKVLRRSFRLRACECIHATTRNHLRSLTAAGLIRLPSKFL